MIVFTRNHGKFYTIHEKLSFLKKLGIDSYRLEDFLAHIEEMTDGVGKIVYWDHDDPGHGEPVSVIVKISSKLTSQEILTRLRGLHVVTSCGVRKHEEHDE